MLGTKDALPNKLAMAEATQAAGSKRKRCMKEVAPSSKPWIMASPKNLKPSPMYAELRKGFDRQRLQCALLKSVPAEDDGREAEIRSSRAPEEPVARLSWSELCLWSHVFGTMREASMAESARGIICMDASPQAIRVLVSFMVQGFSDEICAVDLRELWNLANMYEMDFVKDYLKKNGICRGTVSVVASFAMDVYDDLMGACLEVVAKMAPRMFRRGMLEGMDAGVAKRFLQVFAATDESKQQHGVEDRFDFVQRWLDAQNGSINDLEEARIMVKRWVPFGRMESYFFYGRVMRSGLVQRQFQIYVKRMSGRTATYDASYGERTDALIQRISEREGVPEDQMRLLHCGKQICHGKMVEDYCLGDECTVHLMLRLKGDIGEFQSDGGSAFLTDAGCNLAGPEAMAWCAERAGEKEPIVGRTCLLDKDARERLIAHAEKCAPEGGGGDCVVDILWDELVGMVGHFEFPTDVFGSDKPVTRICLRRTEVKDKSIPFHMDHADRTMQVFLNDEREYEGGQTLFATRKKGLVAARRTPGHFTVHDWDVLHGVTAMRSGVRYALFFLSCEKK